MNHLFKLKKDGKTVGYAHINGYGQLMFRFPKDSDWWCKDKFWDMMREKYGFGIPPCSYYPFVTKDKNGKDVFAGDRIRRINGEPCFVEWFAEECRYVLHNNENYYDMDVFELEQGIELIEDKA